MLIIQQDRGGYVDIGNDVRVHINRVSTKKVWLGIDAPPHVSVRRANAGALKRVAPIIGLVGYAGAGKDTAAKGLCGIGWTSCAFADPLREALLRLDPIITLDGGTFSTLSKHVKHVGWDLAKRQPEVRRLLQTMGTEVVCSVINPHAWIDLMHARLHQMPRDVPVVITDVRFPNEVEFLRKNFNARMLRIVRPGVGPANEHISEGVDLLDVDGEVLNDGSAVQLARRVLDCVQTFEEEATA